MQLCSNLVAWLRVSYCCKMPVNERRAHVQATAYLNKLPDRLTAEDRVLVVDPMLATGKGPLIPDQVLLPRLPSIR